MRDPDLEALFQEAAYKSLHDDITKINETDLLPKKEAVEETLSVEVSERQADGDEESAERDEVEAEEEQP